MNSQNLIIYKFTSLYHILEELSLDLKFKISFIDNENSLKKKLKNNNNYLIISKKKFVNIGNQFILENKPIKIIQLIEKINIEFLKIKFNSQSQVKIKTYTIDLNAREMLIQNIKLKLTEKEINTITYLSNSNKPVSIERNYKKWYGAINRILKPILLKLIFIDLRKKILNTFNDNEFIISKKNGYQIK